MTRINTQMKLKVLLSLLLGFLLVMTAQRDSSARVVQGQEGNKNKLEVTRITTMYAQKEPFERIGAAHMRKLRPGRKKVTTHEETSMDSKNGKGPDGGRTSKISGREKDGLKESFGSSREQKNHQRHMIMGRKALKFTNFVILRRRPTNTNTMCSQDCNAVAGTARLKSSPRSKQQISEEAQGTVQKEETQRLVEAAKEIASLIYKDYKGTPSHKPPINNQEPRN